MDCGHIPYHAIVIKCEDDDHFNVSGNCCGSQRDIYLILEVVAATRGQLE